MISCMGETETESCRKAEKSTGRREEQCPRRLIMPYLSSDRDTRESAANREKQTRDQGDVRERREAERGSTSQFCFLHHPSSSSSSPFHPPREKNMYNHIRIALALSRFWHRFDGLLDAGFRFSVQLCAAFELPIASILCYMYSMQRIAKTKDFLTAALARLSVKLISFVQFYFSL